MNDVKILNYWNYCGAGLNWLMWEWFNVPDSELHLPQGRAPVGQRSERAERSKECLCGAHSCSVPLWEVKPPPPSFRAVFELLQIMRALKSGSPTGARTTLSRVQNHRLLWVLVAHPPCLACQGGDEATSTSASCSHMRAWPSGPLQLSSSS